MSVASAAGALAAALVAFALARPAARLAARVGLVDPRPGAPVPERKRGQTPIPLSGGALVLFAALVGVAVAAAAGAEFAGALGPAPVWALAALGAAFAVGLADDLAPGGLDVVSKLTLQVAAAVVGAFAIAPRIDAAWPALVDAPGASFALAALAALAALECANTFDHADGLCGGVGLIGLALPAPVAAGALVGWLPANFDRRPPERPAPSSLLGDGGAHLVGMALAVVPGAWPALLVPALDLGRVVVERVRAGERPWHGDRRHLGQRLAAAGHMPRTAALLAAAPTVLAVAGHALGTPAATLLGLALGAALYAWFLARSRPAAPPTA